MKRAALLALALTAALVPAAAIAASVPDAGVKIYNQPMCGANQFVRVKLPASEFTVHDSDGVCISSMRHRLDFRVTSASDIPWSMPYISSGYALGESSCASSRDTCYRYPVEQRNDGAPVASVKAWLAPGTYNLSFDTWFAPSYRDTSYADRAGDTEVMIWLAHPGINDTAHYDWYADIDGTRWGVMTWEAGQHSGHPWRYVAYVAPRTALGRLSRANLWLNPIWRNAEAHGYLSSVEWLTAVDLGFELVRNGVGDNIHYYSLRGVR